MSTNQLLGLEDIAALYEVPVGTAYSWKHRGQLPAPAGMIGKRPFWQEAQFETWTPPRPVRTRRQDLHEDR